MRFDIDKELNVSIYYQLYNQIRNKGYRKLIVDNYIVFYLIEEENHQVIIMRVLYGRQKYENLL